VFSDKHEKVILVGHGMGAWISFLIAMKRPDLVSGIVGLSADPDFTEELLWKTLSEEVKTRIMDEGEAQVSWGKENYKITRNLIVDARNNLLLAGGPGFFMSCTYYYIFLLSKKTTKNFLLKPRTFIKNKTIIMKRITKREMPSAIDPRFE
jgi:pimeloyl-ACP methyl ester carboxylesterase